jgi:hypothetical protein
MITRTDKGNSVVILLTQYETTIQNFLLNNNFHTITTDPTKFFQAQIRKMVKENKTLIPHDARWKYINMNPSAPSIKGLIKIHKSDQPIWPVVNWCNAPAYKLYKLFTNKINHIASLPNAFNIKNTNDLIQNLKDTPLLPHFTFASLDITNLYLNILVIETKTILTNMLK